MAELLRTFIAVKVEPAPALLQTMRELKSELAGEQIKWVEETNLHLTLKFLGDTAPWQVDEVNEVLNQVAKSFSSFSFQLEGLGFFTNNGMPRGLFVKIDEGEELQHLAAEIDNRLATLGFEPETRPFKPHLTLARIKFLKNKKAFYQAVEKHRDTFLQAVTINQLIFYRSILQPEGPEYLPLNMFKL